MHFYILEFVILFQLISIKFIKLECVQENQKNIILFSLLNVGEIEKYIDCRERNGEKIKGSAPLIREKFNRCDTIASSKPKQLKLDSL